MKRTVWTFGLIAGAILSIMMLITVPFADRIGFDKSLIVGYTTMVLGFLMIFFGVKSYRDNMGGGSISFGRALTIGLLITVIASLLRRHLAGHQLHDDAGFRRQVRRLRCRTGQKIRRLPG